MMSPIVEEALHYGINWFDTPEINSEEALAVALDEIGGGAGRRGHRPQWWPLLRSAQPLEILERRPHRELIRPRGMRPIFAERFNRSP